MFCEMFLSSALFVACLLNLLTPSYELKNNVNRSNYNNELNVNQIYRESDNKNILKISPNTSNNYNSTSSIADFHGTTRAVEINPIPNIDTKSKVELKRRKFTPIRQSSGYIGELTTEPETITQFSEEGRVKKKKKREEPTYHGLSEYSRPEILDDAARGDMDYIQDLKRTEKSDYDDHINILENVSKMYQYLKTRTNPEGTVPFESDLMQDVEKGNTDDTKAKENLDERKQYHVNSLYEPTSEGSIAETQSLGYSEVESTTQTVDLKKSTCSKKKITPTNSATLSNPDLAEIVERSVNNKLNKRRKGDLKPNKTDKDLLSEITDTNEIESKSGKFHSKKKPILNPNFSTLRYIYTSAEEKNQSVYCSKDSMNKKPFLDNNVDLKVEENNKYIKIVFGDSDSSDPPFNVEDLPMLITILIDKPIE